MPPAHRLGDICTGHGCWPPRPSCAGSGNVFINSIPANRVGDGYPPHPCPPAPPHPAVSAAGSPNVFTNSKAQVRVGDAVSCGGSAAVGSGNVIVN